MVAPLDRKLWRDLKATRTQALAIAMVVAVGVLLLVMMDGLVNSLEQTKATYYERYRLADVFAPAKRAPKRLLERIANLEGVAAVEGRVVGGALIDLPGQAVPVRAQAVSLPDYREPRLNAIYLSDGRHLDPRRRDEVLLLEGFAQAHGLRPGDRLTATMNGARRSFAIVGLAQSPEFLYAVAPGELTPDDSRFAVLWMSEENLAAAFDVDGAFNEALIALDRGAREPAVLAAVDRLLRPFGGIGAYTLADQFSNRIVSEEIEGLRLSATNVPPIFMAVAAFLLYIVITRMVQAERTQIGLLKAFGYRSTAIAAHYLKFALVIAIGGALLGCLLGLLSGQALARTYQTYFKFPFLEFQVDPAAFAIGIATSVAAACTGGMLVLRRIFLLAPAVAMRPPAPASYARSARLFGRLRRFLDQPSRMVLRQLLRQPGRAFAAILGIAVGMGLCAATLGVLAGFDEAVALNFSVVDRSDATVTLIEPLSDRTVFELQRVPGIVKVEPFRAVSVILRNGRKSHRGGINGLVPEPQLGRALTTELDPLYLRDEGIVLAASLARKLDVAAGARLSVEVREGRRPVLDLPVIAIADTLIGAPAYMSLRGLNQALREPGRISGAYLRVDSQQAQTTYETLKGMPAVAGVTLRSEAQASLQRMMDEGSGGMRFVMALVAAIITFGIVFNSARIAFAERAQDLASLRVLGFTRAEAAYVLLGELALMILLALPLGALTGMLLADGLAAGFSSDLYSVPARIDAGAVGTASLAVLGAALLSGWLVKRDIDQLDLVSAMKSRD
ncbi:MAG: FtsX-like permease family protein [Pseudomonadota bacterium]